MRKTLKLCNNCLLRNEHLIGQRATIPREDKRKRRLGKYLGQFDKEDILKYIGEGKSSLEIAALLDLSYMGVLKIVKKLKLKEK